MCVGGGEEIPRTQDLADSLVLSPWIMTSSLTPGWSWGQKMAINLEVYKYICVILVQICKLLIVNWVEFLFLKDNGPLRKKMFYFILVPFVFSRTSEQRNLSGDKWETIQVHQSFSVKLYTTVSNSSQRSNWHLEEGECKLHKRPCLNWSPLYPLPGGVTRAWLIDSSHLVCIC